MKYNNLGRSGLLVSSFSLGTANMSLSDPAGGGLPGFGFEDTKRVIDLAIDCGINFFDCADVYGMGDSDKVVGKALGKKRRDVVILSKVGLRMGAPATAAGLSRRHLFTSIDDVLQRLGTDWIDVLTVHRTDPHTPLEETLSALDDIVRSGKARYIGYSNWPAWLAAKAIGLQRQYGWSPFVVAQMYYSLAGRELEHDTIPFAQDAGVGIMAWSPLSSGYLTGKYTAQDPTGGGGRRAHFAMGPFDFDKAAKIADVVRDVAAAHDTTPAAVALAWLADQPAVASTILGLTRIDQLEANLAALEVALTAEDHRALDEVSRTPEPYPNWYNTLMTDDAAQDALAGQYDQASVIVGPAAYSRYYLNKEPTQGSEPSSE